MRLSKLQEIVENTEIWHAAVHGLGAGHNLELNNDKEGKARLIVRKNGAVIFRQILQYQMLGLILSILLF